VLKNYRNNKMIPKGIQDSLNDWLVHGNLQGAFIMAILENNLSRTINLSDDSNIGSIKEIINFVWNNFPASSWGSSESVKEWARTGGLKGKHEANKRRELLDIKDD
jgi:hypothetical protein